MWSTSSLRTPNLLHSIASAAGHVDDCTWLSTGQSGWLNGAGGSTNTLTPSDKDAVSEVIRQLSYDDSAPGQGRWEGGTGMSPAHGVQCAARHGGAAGDQHEPCSQAGTGAGRLQSDLASLTQQLKASQEAVAAVWGDNRRLQHSLGLQPHSNFATRQPPAVHGSKASPLREGGGTQLQATGPMGRSSPGSAGRSMPTPSRPASTGGAGGTGPGAAGAAGGSRALAVTGPPFSPGATADPTKLSIGTGANSSRRPGDRAGTGLPGKRAMLVAMQHLSTERTR